MDAMHLRRKQLPYAPCFVFHVLSGFVEKGAVKIETVASHIIVTTSKETALEKWAFAVRRSPAEAPLLCVSLEEMQILRQRAVDSTWVEGKSPKLPPALAKDKNDLEPWLVALDSDDERRTLESDRILTVLASNASDIEAWAATNHQRVAHAYPMSRIDEAISDLERAAAGCEEIPILYFNPDELAEIPFRVDWERIKERSKARAAQ